jgi:predicted enzyme related to lactoylglutathione lyase
LSFPRQGDCGVQENESIFWFSVSDLEKAKQFYGEALALDVSDAPMGLFWDTKIGHIAQPVRNRL